MQDLKALNQVNKNTLMEWLQIEYTNYQPGLLEAKMPVNERTHQPMGLLHGGASVALAETIGSYLSTLEVGVENYIVKGMQISANHLKSVQSGYVFGKATFLHKGKSSHIIDISIVDEDDNLVSTCRLTNAILKK